MIQFNPIEHTYVAPIDLESFSKSMDRLETGHKAALEGQSNLLTTFYNMGFNKEEFQQGPNGEPSWVDQKVSQIKQQIDEASMYGNYASSQDVVTKLTQDIATDPSVNGRLWSNKAHTEFEENVDKMVEKGDLPQDIADYLKLVNPYFYEDSIDDAGNVSMGDIWKPYASPAKHYNISDIMNAAFDLLFDQGTVSRESDYSNSTNDYSEDNASGDNGTNNKKPTTSSSSSNKTTNSIKKYYRRNDGYPITDNDIVDAIMRMADINEDCRNSIQQQYNCQLYLAARTYSNILNPVYDREGKLIDVEIDVDQWKDAYNSDDNLRLLFDNEGRELNYRDYLRRLVNRNCLIASPIISVVRTVNETRPATPATSATIATKATPPVQSTKRTTQRRNKEGHRMGGYSIMAMGGESDDENNISEKNDILNEDDNSSLFREYAEEDTTRYGKPFSYVGLLQPVKVGNQIALSNTYATASYRMTQANASFYNIIGNLLDGTDLEDHDILALYNYYKNNHDADIGAFIDWIDNGFEKPNGNGDFNDDEFNSLYTAINSYIQNDSIIKNFSSAERRESYKFMYDLQSGNITNETKGGKKINDKLNNAFRNDNKIIFEISPQCLSKYINIQKRKGYNISKLEDIPYIKKAISTSENGNYVVTFDDSMRNYAPIFATDIENAKSEAMYEMGGWNNFKNYFFKYWGNYSRVNPGDYGITQTGSNDNFGSNGSITDRFSFSSLSNIATAGLMWYFGGKVGQGIGWTAQRIPKASKFFKAWADSNNWFAKITRGTLKHAGSRGAFLTANTLTSENWLDMLIGTPWDTGRFLADSKSENAYDLMSEISKTYNEYYSKYSKELSQNSGEEGNIIQLYGVNSSNKGRYVNALDYKDEVTAERKNADNMADNVFYNLITLENLLQKPMFLVDENGSIIPVQDPEIFAAALEHANLNGHKFKSCYIHDFPPQMNYANGIDFNNFLPSEAHCFKFEFDKDVADSYFGEFISNIPSRRKRDIHNKAEKYSNKEITLIVQGLYGNNGSYGVPDITPYGDVNNKFNFAIATNSPTVYLDNYLDWIGDPDFKRNDMNQSYNEDWYTTEAFNNSTTLLLDDAKQLAVQLYNIQTVTQAILYGGLYNFANTDPDSNNDYQTALDIQSEVCAKIMMKDPNRKYDPNYNFNELSAEIKAYIDMHIKYKWYQLQQQRIRKDAEKKDIPDSVLNRYGDLSKGTVRFNYRP